MSPREVRAAVKTAAIAARVDWSESGQRCPYVSSVVTADACRSRA